MRPLIIAFAGIAVQSFLLTSARFRLKRSRLFTREILLPLLEAVREGDENAIIYYRLQLDDFFETDMKSVLFDLNPYNWYKYWNYHCEAYESKKVVK